jgi:hypothetical protein
MILMVQFPIRPKASRLIAAVGTVLSMSAICAVTCTPVAHATSAAAPCAGASDLHLRIANQGRETSGITDYTLDFTNTSRSTCSLSGYPYVSMVSRKGSQLGSPAGHGLMTIAPLVILAPGATAHTTLAYHAGIINGRRGCGPVATAYELRVYVAGQKLALYGAMGLHACSRAGQVYLTITGPFRNGAGSS